MGAFPSRLRLLLQRCGQVCGSLGGRLAPARSLVWKVQAGHRRLGRRWVGEPGWARRVRSAAAAEAAARRACACAYASAWAEVWWCTACCFTRGLAGYAGGFVLGGTVQWWWNAWMEGAAGNGDGYSAVYC
jgi:hypothetical protein